ncbi:hypothetical protein ACFUTX_08475 [Microbacterium sp. NPDC057407]|uniref:hypothetical protein n=1 Tax=Microbacterium sp. NPDC057407 TaxID=3346120 RepID=UPI00366B1D18
MSTPLVKTKIVLALTLVLASVTVLLTGCVATAALPSYETAKAETNAAIRAVADHVPDTVDELMREGDPYVCGDMLDSSGEDRPIFYTGNLDLRQPEGFDPERFIDELPEKLGKDFEVVPRHPIEGVLAVSLNAHSHGGARLSVTAGTSDSGPYVYIIGMSRCAQPIPPTVAEAPLPDYDAVRREALAAAREVAATLPRRVQTMRHDSLPTKCDDVVDPFSAFAPVRYQGGLEYDVSDDFDGEKYLEELPTLLGDDFDVIPRLVPDIVPKVDIVAHRHGDAALTLSVWPYGDVFISMYSQCADGATVDR